MEHKTVRMPKSLSEKIDDYRREMANDPLDAPGQAEAIRELIRRGLQQKELKA